MDPQFLPHNAHLESIQTFLTNDPQLRRLKNQPYIYHSPLIDQFPTNTFGIYTLGGGRQIGKTTLLKQWMAKLLNENIQPESIAFLSGELIEDYHSLLRLLQTQLAKMPENKMKYLIIDEVTYIRDWDKAIKYAADAGLLEQTELMLTGSELTVIQEARMRFPGRRGQAKKVDFHLYPLSFREFVALKKSFSEPIEEILSQEKLRISVINKLFEEFNNYLQHGGYLTAINNLALYNQISKATLSTYSDWIRGDVLKRGKQEHYLREILSAILKHYNSQITWNTLTQSLSIEHHKTVSNYIELLSSMDALFILYPLQEDKKTASLKKARKLFFTDPFIFHAIKAWLKPTDNPYEKQILAAINDAKLSSQLVEACVATHYRRFYPTYYIKAKGEVDVAYINNGRFWPIEIKWTNQLRPKDLKQIQKYPNSKILTKTNSKGYIFDIETEPVPLNLLRLKEPK